MQDVVNYLSLHEAISCKCRKKASIVDKKVFYFSRNRCAIVALIDLLVCSKYSLFWQS